MANPAIVLVSEDHADELLSEFQSRYARDYDLPVAHSCAEAVEVAQTICDAGDLVALFVSDSRLPDVDTVLAAFAKWRSIVPNARRVVAAH